MFKQRSREQACKIVSVVMLADQNETAVLSLAAGLVGIVDEALSAAIVETAAESTMALGHVDHVQLITDNGVAGWVDGHAVILGNSSFLADLRLSVGRFGTWAERTAPEDETVIFVAVDGQLAGFLKAVAKYQKNEI